ncbi:MAG: alanine racemase [Methylobacteriaceae bacterium]|nr:alanine racemase [Methylobacteriaceae bacterium]
MRPTPLPGPPPQGGRERRRAPQASAPAEAPAILTIDLDALVANWRALATRVAPAECSAVVKAEAYGTGLPAVRALAKAGCRTFFVAHLAEGRQVRTVMPDATIYILGGLLPETEATHAHFALRPVLGSGEEIARWRRLAATCDPCPAAIHIDTGMNRLGLSPDEARRLLISDDGLRGFPVALLMSHFVASEEPEAPINSHQIELFEELRALRPEIPASLANSSGIFLPQRPYFDLVRPGYALYGGNPTPGAPNPMRGIVKLQARILQCRTVEAGETVGYGATWTAPDRRRLATIGTGYADGFLRSGSPTDATAGGQAFIAGSHTPFVGRISMDLIVIDVTGVTTEAKAGDLVELIGEHLPIDIVGRNAGSIGYEILTSLGRRYHRAYIGR